jgi:putative salt-induced outer membrane protein YdiY
MRMRAIRIGRVLMFAAGMAIAATASAQVQPLPKEPAPPPKELPMGSSNSSELGLVIATGNARSTSVGLRNVYTYRWERAEFGWEGGWLRAASRDGDRFAVEAGSGFEVVDPDSAVDSHRLFSKLRYQRQFTRRMDWFSNFDAVRDEPSNINRQFVLAAGVGTTWSKTDRLTFRTAYGISYTDEDLVVEGENRFAGYRLYYGLRAPLTTTTRFESELTLDGSFETGDDIRADALNSITVAISSNVALKSSIRVLFRNLPALESLDLRSPSGVTVGMVEVPKETIDTNLTTSLVITF